MTTTRAPHDASRNGLDRPDILQEECLLKRIVEPNRDCEYGCRHQFRVVRSVRDYQRAVPIVRYENIRADVDRMARGEASVLVAEPVRHFFLTSGSTGEPKRVPVTASLIRDKWRAFGTYWSRVFERHPSVNRSTMVMSLVESGAPTLTWGGIPCSSESAFWSAWSSGLSLRRTPLVPREIGSIVDVDARAYATARILLEEDLPLLMALHPSTLLVFLQKLSDFADSLIEDVARGGLGATVNVDDSVRDLVAARCPANPTRARELEALLHDDGPRLIASEIWLSLALVVCWRSPMLRPYLRLLEPYIGGAAQRDYVCMASEGVIAIPFDDVDEGPGGVLATETHFFEFVAEEEVDCSEPEVRLAHELEVGRRYVVILSTSAGLYRYHIGDVVRVHGFRGATPIVEFLHRAGATCSMTGEKLTEDQVTEAVSASASAIGIDLESFTLFPAAEPFPHYVLLVEVASPAQPQRLASFPGTLDREIERQNIEYATKRASLRLGPPEVWIVEPGGYAAWQRRRVMNGASPDQLKPIHLTRNASVLHEFEIAERIHADSRR
ncbi:MAG: GH3 auxin-responsive promoter family protein [Planctomycetes bacterium]|nr:GH3 auxin-responsive promoter family protein [Planctomycetota bacterium]MBI3843465.1 GH3 auxin-responsive promoter family protein [Planctomycetota bacterium]